MGQVQTKIDNSFEHFKGKDIGFMPWGVGNHGGGPSRDDLAIIAENQAKESEFVLQHSTPEEYFKDLSTLDLDLPVVKKSLVPCFVGCYTSQIQIKKKHRELENMLYSTGKIATAASLHNLIKYPTEKFDQAMKYLAMVQLVHLKNLKIMMVMCLEFMKAQEKIQVQLLLWKLAWLRIYRGRKNMNLRNPEKNTDQYLFGHGMKNLTL